MTRTRDRIFTALRASVGWLALGAALVVDGRTETLAYAAVGACMFYQIYSDDRRRSPAVFNSVVAADEFTGIVCSHVQTDDRLRKEITMLGGYGAEGPAVYGWFTAAANQKVARDAMSEIAHAGLRRVDWRHVVKAASAGPDWTALRGK